MAINQPQYRLPDLLTHSQESSYSFVRSFFSCDSQEQSAELREVLLLRREFGRAVPFSTSDVLGLPCGFRVPNMVIMNRATECMRPGTGNYYLRYILNQPEGRHQVTSRVLREVIGCMSFLGVEVDREHAFALVTELREPENDIDHLIHRFGKLLLAIPTTKMTPEALKETYDGLLSGLSMETGSRLDERTNAGDRFRSLQAICDYLYDESDSRDHPMIKALFVAESIRQMKPFPMVNLIMARVAFSWAANQVGLPIAGYMLLTTFLDNWASAKPITEGYVPRLPLAEALPWDPSIGTDWSFWLEEVLGFIADALNHFETRMLRLLMKRERVEYLATFAKGLNDRQRTLLCELLLHDDAEFTYASVIDTFGVAYATAYADLGKLEAKGYVRAIPMSKATVFIASDDCREVFHRAIRAAAPEEYAQFYNEDGTLADSYIAEQDDILARYKKSIPLHGEYVQIARPTLLPERCLVILTESDRKKK